MIVTSLYKLAVTNNGGVYKYLVKLLEGRDSDITLSESLILYAGVTKFKDCPEKDFSHFLSLFSNNKRLVQLLTKLKDSGIYDFLVNEKSVDYEALGENNYFLIDEYIKIFGKENISFAPEEKLEVMSENWGA